MPTYKIEVIVDIPDDGDTADRTLTAAMRNLFPDAHDITVSEAVQHGPQTVDGLTFRICGECAVAGLAGTQDAWDEHVDFSRFDWRQEVAAGDTQRSYWDWVWAQIEEREEAPE